MILRFRLVTGNTYSTADFPTIAEALDTMKVFPHFAVHTFSGARVILTADHIVSIEEITP
jgi:hypothetical protein